MATHIDLKFADGEYRFALPLERIDELQSKTGVGIGGLYARVLQGRQESDPLAEGHPAYAAYFARDLYETVRQGLIGGGEGTVDGQPVVVTTIRANELVERYLATMPLREQWDVAAAILFACIEGYDDPEAKEEKPEAKKKVTTKAGSTTPAP